MIDKLIKEANKKYNLYITYKTKMPEVYFIYFEIENKGISFNFMFNRLMTYELNQKEFERKLNNEIINYYLKKG